MGIQLPPRIKRWASIAATIAGLAYIAFNPDILWQKQQTAPPVQTQNRPSRPVTPGQAKVGNSGTAGFDFYVLALSWSPSYCASKNRKSGLQCGGKRYYSFVVHGLWPQYEKGWPANCDARARRVGRDLVNSMLDIMPGEGLIQHEWKKHGTCSGLSQKSYFATLRAAYDKIRFPARLRLNNRYLMVTPQSVENSFRNENPGLATNAIAVTCDKRRLREVRICFSKNLEFRACKQVNKNACRRQKIVMPPVRGS